MSPRVMERVKAAQREDVNSEAVLARRALRRSTREESKLKQVNTRPFNSRYSMPDLRNKIENYLKRQSMK